MFASAIRRFRLEVMHRRITTNRIQFDLVYLLNGNDAGDGARQPNARGKTCPNKSHFRNAGAHFETRTRIYE